MQITDLSKGLPCSAETQVTQYRPDGTCCTTRKAVIRENLLDVWIDEKLTLRMVCITTDLPALILGHLYTEGMIENAAAVQSIWVSGDGGTAKVTMDTPISAIEKPLEIRACDCGANGILGRNLLEEKKETGIGETEPFCAQWAFALAEEFSKGSSLHTETHGTHSAYLSRKGKLLYSCEDLGRHNALDKVIGRALLDGVSLGECMIITSGRVPVDMIQKAIRSGISVLISNAVPTDRALALAKQYGVRLITTARREHMDELAVP